MKKYLIGFILGILTVGIIKVSAETFFPSNQVTYDNTESGLTSSNVQGAIDELYGVCTAEPPSGDQIIENGNLEKDEYECRYFFTGANPNNYITFNNEDAGWRIISVECDGTIKIMRTASIGNQVWNYSNSNNWTEPASLNTYLNGTYYNGLNSTAQSQIVAKDWSIGSITYNVNNLTNTINNENSKRWNGKVALVTASEYVRSNSNKSSCGTVQQLWDNASGLCKETTWMYYSSNYWWTLSSRSDNSVTVFTINNSYGGFSYNNGNANNSNAVRPTLYLSSEVKLSGSGTQSDPYVVS